MKPISIWAHLLFILPFWLFLLLCPSLRAGNDVLAYYLNTVYDILLSVWNIFNICMCFLTQWFPKYDKYYSLNFKIALGYPWWSYFFLIMWELRHRKEKVIPDKMAIELGDVNWKTVQILWKPSPWFKPQFMKTIAEEGKNISDKEKILSLSL